MTPTTSPRDLHDSLARLQVDFVDLYLLHRDNPAVPVGPIVEVLNEHHKAGKIGAFGGSNWSPARIAEANAYAAANGLKPFVASSPTQHGGAGGRTVAQLPEHQRPRRRGRPRLVRGAADAPLRVVEPGRRLPYRPLPPSQSGYFQRLR
ncbi:MAG: aldo/keto reductase [Caldilineaceae bacterium]